MDTGWVVWTTVKRSTDKTESYVCALLRVAFEDLIDISGAIGGWRVCFKKKPLSADSKWTSTDKLTSKKNNRQRIIYKSFQSKWNETNSSLINT